MAPVLEWLVPRGEIRFVLNDTDVSGSWPPGITALDFLRGNPALRGTKEGCREGECGACTALVGSLTSDGLVYRAMTTCLLPLGELHGRHLLTIEALRGNELTPVQRAFFDERAAQCGFCTPGFVMALTGFFLESPDLSPGDALDAMDGNICRCTGYVPIQRAARGLCERFSPQVEGGADRVDQAVGWGVLPEFCRAVPQRLREIEPAPSRGRGVLVAGGTDLLIQSPDELATGPLRLVSRIPGLGSISVEGGVLRIGSNVTVEQLRRSPVMADCLPDLQGVLTLFASTIVRNRATVGGNIANASPIGDLSVVLLALGSRLVIAGSKGSRSVDLDRFFLGYKKKDLRRGEVIETIEVPVPGDQVRFGFEKVSRRRNLDIASVNCAALFVVEGGRIATCRMAAGGVAPVPLLLRRTAEALAGRRPSVETALLGAESAAAEAAPISDVRGNAAYKRLLLRRLILAQFLKCFPEEIQAEALAAAVVAS